MEKIISEINYFSLKYANTHAITDQQPIKRLAISEISNGYSSKSITIFQAYFLLGYTFVDNSFQDRFEYLLTFHKKNWIYTIKYLQIQT